MTDEIASEIGEQILENLLDDLQSSKAAFMVYLDENHKITKANYTIPNRIDPVPDDLKDICNDKAFIAQMVIRQEALDRLQKDMDMMKDDGFTDIDID